MHSFMQSFAALSEGYITTKSYNETFHALKTFLICSMNIATSYNYLSIKIWFSSLKITRAVPRILPLIILSKIYIWDCQYDLHWHKVSFKGNAEMAGFFFY